MRTRSFCVGLLASLLIGLAVYAVGWDKFEGGATIVTDSDTDVQSVVFNLGLAYDSKPSHMQISTSWEVYVIEDGVETILDAWSRTSRKTPATDRVWSSSSRIPIEAGKRYGARLVMEDIENGLSHRETFSYFAPLELSIGIRLTGDTGAQLFDMTGVPEDELAELARLDSAIASYEELATSVELTSLFSQHATSSDAFPVSVLIMPDTGIDSHGGTKDVTITLRFGLQVLVYSIEDRATTSSFLSQIALFEETFSGSVYAGPGTDGFGEGVTIFVHDAVFPILDAASRGGD